MDGRPCSASSDWSAFIAVHAQYSDRSRLDLEVDGNRLTVYVTYEQAILNWGNPLCPYFSKYGWLGAVFHGVAPYYLALSASKAYTVKNACFTRAHWSMGNGREIERYVDLTGAEHQVARLNPRTSARHERLVWCYRVSPFWRLQGARSPTRRPMMSAERTQSSGKTRTDPCTGCVPAPRVRQTGRMTLPPAMRAAPEPSPVVDRSCLNCLNASFSLLIAASSLPALHVNRLRCPFTSRARL
jgi:hypothetical protein